MEHVTFFFSVSGRYCSQGTGAFLDERVPREGGGQGPKGVEEMSQSLLEQVSDIDLLLQAFLRNEKPRGGRKRITV